MEVKILFRNYGKGKERIILMDKSNNLAFASFGKKDTPYKYLYEQFKKKKMRVNQIKDLLALLLIVAVLASCKKEHKEPSPPVPPIEIIVDSTNGVIVSNQPIKINGSNRDLGTGRIAISFNQAASTYLINETDVSYLQFLVGNTVFRTLTLDKYSEWANCDDNRQNAVVLYVFMEDQVSDPITVRWKDDRGRNVWGDFTVAAQRDQCRPHFNSDNGITLSYGIRRIRG